MMISLMPTVRSTSERRQDTAESARQDPWRVYQRMRTRDLEATYAAIKVYSLAVSQLGTFLRAERMPVGPTNVTREHLTEWMRYLRLTADGLHRPNRPFSLS